MPTDSISTLKVGDELVPLTWHTGPANWNRYAAVNDEFIGIHMDDSIAQRAGFAGAIGMGNLQYSYMHIALRQWFGLDATIEGVDIRFKQPNLKDQVLTVAGTLTELTPDGAHLLVTIELSVTADNGASLSSGGAAVRVAVDGS